MEGVYEPANQVCCSSKHETASKDQKFYLLIPDSSVNVEQSLTLDSARFFPIFNHIVGASELGYNINNRY